MTSQELIDKQEKLREKIDKRALELGYDHNVIAPIHDGVNEDHAQEYLESKLRILWIMKEPYDEEVNGKPQGGGWKMTDYTLTLHMFRTMAKIVYGIYNEKYFDEIPQPDENMLKLLQSTAYMNVSKMPGKTSSSDAQLRKRIKEWKDILQEQLELYHPDVIILGHTYEGLMEGHLGDDPTTDSIDEASDYGTVAILKNKRGQIIVDAFHPSHGRMRRKPDLTDEKYINTIIKGVLTAIGK